MVALFQSKQGQEVQEMVASSEIKSMFNLHNTFVKPCWLLCVKNDMSRTL